MTEQRLGRDNYSNSEGRRYELGKWLFAQECRFFFGAQGLDQLFVATLPEIAFVGRSNVGKSNLINALTGRHKLARTSSHPGRTQQLNFFNLGNRIILVDMPGYGYAKAAKSVKENWQATMLGYLKARPSLRRVILLLDSRIPIKSIDKVVMAMFDKVAVVFHVVLTKCDLLSTVDLRRKIDETRSLLSQYTAAYLDIMPTSSVTGLGIDELRAEIAVFADYKRDISQSTDRG